MSETLINPNGQATMANSEPVVIASDQSVVPVSDNSGSLTVDGTVTANAGTNLNTSALALEAGGNLAAAAGSLNAIDDWDETDRCKVNPIAGQAGVQGASGVVTALTQRVVLATDVGLPAGTSNIGDVDVATLPSIPAGTNNIGDVDVLSVIPGTGATNLGKALDSVPGFTDTGVAIFAKYNNLHQQISGTEGDYSLLSCDSEGNLFVAGNRKHNVDDGVTAPVKVATKTVTLSTTPTHMTAVGYRADWPSNSYGVPYVTPGSPHDISITAQRTTNGTTTAVAPPGSNLHIVVTSYVIFPSYGNSAGVGVSLKSNTGTVHRNFAVMGPGNGVGEPACRIICDVNKALEFITDTASRTVDFNFTYHVEKDA